MLSLRTILRTWPSLLLTGAGLFLLLESSARVYLFGLAGLDPRRINSVHSLTQTGYTQPATLRGLPFELRPNTDGHFKLVQFRTSSTGLRDDEYSLEKPEGTFRVAVLGSSFALPAGVAIEDAFHSLLERRFSDEDTTRRFEFLNFAVGMYNPAHVLTVLEERALEYEPDLILFTATRLAMPLLVGGPVEAVADGADKRPVSIRFERSYPFLQSFLLALIRSRTQAAGDDDPNRWQRIGTLERIYMDWVNEPPPEKRTPRRRGDGSGRLAGAHRLEGSILEQLAAIGHRAGVPVALVHLEFESRESSAPELQVAEEARSLGIHFVDTREGFRGSRASDFWIYPLDPHPNAEAHEIFAGTIARFLRAERLVPEPLD